MINYDAIYDIVVAIGQARIGEWYIMRLIAPIFLVVILWFSRVMASPVIKIFAVLVSMILYFMPVLVGVFRS